MPELPEVETTRRGIEPHLLGERLAGADVRQPKLRYPVPARLSERIAGGVVRSVSRRAKYLLIEVDEGTLVIHLGMSGSLRYLALPGTAGRHDHVDIVLGSGAVVRYTDPRRFGLIDWWQGRSEDYPRLVHLGPEPLAGQFDAALLFDRCRKRRVAIKSVIMDGKVVVGVGNIYASEALFRAAIAPGLNASALTLAQCERLVDAIRAVLDEAIAAGGSTLRDFVASDGRPGYFARRLAVYGRAGEACQQCGTAIVSCRIGQRSSFYCPRCQSA
jgi:formamidopyrimidine-DNA glycosylase